MLQIKCPETGKPVDTGVDMPKEAVESGAITLENNTVMCPHCEKTHTWSAKDVL